MFVQLSCLTDGLELPHWVQFLDCTRLETFDTQAPTVVCLIRKDMILLFPLA